MENLIEWRKDMSIDKCIGCKAYSEYPPFTSCMFIQRAKKECPCWTCIVKSICIKRCLPFIFQVNESMQYIRKKNRPCQKTPAKTVSP